MASYPQNIKISQVVVDEVNNKAFLDIGGTINEIPLNQTDCCDQVIEIVDAVEVIDNKIDSLTEQSEECCDILSDKLDKIESKLKPKVVIKPVYIDRVVYKHIYTIVYKTDYVISYKNCNKENPRSNDEILVPQKSVIRKIVTPTILNPCLIYENELKRDIDESKKRWERDRNKRYKNFGWMVWQLYSNSNEIFKPKCWQETYIKVIFDVFGERLTKIK